MNAVPRSVLPQRHQPRRQATNSQGTRSRATLSSTVSVPSRNTGKKVEKLNTSRQQTPIWLSSLLFLQRSSDVVTFILVATTLTIYSWTVYTQQQWTKEYQKLETLQRHERHLTTTNAVIKDQLAQQAENPATGLVTPTPANTIFLPPAPQRQAQTIPTSIAEAESKATTPLGY